MARLSSAFGAGVVVVVALGLGACTRAPKEGPPPAESLEIASAAPRALGALAGGTEAAPTGWRASPTSDPEAAPDDTDDDEDGGVAPGHDAGATSPEDLPL